MSVLVTQEGFIPVQTISYDGVKNIWVEPDQSIEDIHHEDASLISVHFPNFADGRGFGLAKQIRAKGYSGTLRAVGHVISDQYAMAQRVGYDEVEISNDLAARQDASQWHAREDWKRFDYQARLGQERAEK